MLFSTSTYIPSCTPQWPGTMNRMVLATVTAALMNQPPRKLTGWRSTHSTTSSSSTPTSRARKCSPTASWILAAAAPIEPAQVPVEHAQRRLLFPQQPPQRR